MKKRKTIREELQEMEDEQVDGYQLKSNEDVIDIIKDFGNGETEFHTLDINRKNKILIDYLDQYINHCISNYHLPLQRRDHTLPERILKVFGLKKDFSNYEEAIKEIENS